MMQQQPRSTLFPYTTLFRSWALLDAGASPWLWLVLPALARFGALVLLRLAPLARREGLAWTWRRHLARQDLGLALLDRKSTRLNSSHVRISYAVFCLKKKKM